MQYTYYTNFNRLFVQHAQKHVNLYVMLYNLGSKFVQYVNMAAYLTNGNERKRKYEVVRHKRVA